MAEVTDTQQHSGPWQHPGLQEAAYNAASTLLCAVWGAPVRAPP